MIRLLHFFMAVVILSLTLVPLAPTPGPSNEPVEIRQDILPYRFADREEGISLFKGNAGYYNGFTRNDLDYRLQKQGGELEEWLSFACDQVRDFTDAEKAAVHRSISRISSILDEKGYVLPELDEIVFVKTTMLEECDASAYTHGTQIYLGESFLKAGMMETDELRNYFDMVMCHEVFHCLTRCNPQFRKDMYEIIGFTVADEEFEMGPAVLDRFISNPDVGRHDSYAEFTINGEKMNCFTVYVTTKPFEKKGEIFFKNATTGLVPIDDTNVLYTMDDASDFWEVFGQNTDYVIDPEECLADNFAYAIMFGSTNKAGEPLKSPHITEAIDQYLKGSSR